MDAFGISQICLDRTFENGKFWALNTNHELWDFYLENDGLLLDPNVIDPETLCNRFFVWSTCDNDNYSEILSGFSKFFQLKQGASIARLMPDKSNIGISFGCNKSDPGFIPKLLNESKLVNSFFIYLQKELADVIEDIERHPFNSNQYKKNDFLVEEGSGFRLEMNRRKDLLLLMGCLSKEDEWLANITLTQRQSQSAVLYLQGLTVEDISKQLNISYDAVKDQMEWTKKKLRVRKKRDLIKNLSILSELGLLSYENIKLRVV